MRMVSILPSNSRQESKWMNFSKSLTIPLKGLASAVMNSKWINIYCRLACQQLCMWALNYKLLFSFSIHFSVNHRLRKYILCLLPLLFSLESAAGIREHLVSVLIALLFPLSQFFLIGMCILCFTFSWREFFSPFFVTFFFHTPVSIIYSLYSILFPLCQFSPCGSPFCSLHLDLLFSLSPTHSTVFLSAILFLITFIFPLHHPPVFHP